MRQWSLDKYVELIELLLATERVQVALIGGADDADTAGSILKRLGKRDGVFDLFGKLSLKDLPKLLRRAALFVGNNSGPQHVAAGLGVPTLGIHSGVVDAREWGPLGARAVAIRRDMSCSPCYIEKPADCPRALACLHELSAAAVFANCLQLLADPSIALGLPRHATLEPARRTARRAP
jgi:ADP-heptose:LPS heptosyltransferase